MLEHADDAVRAARQALPEWSGGSFDARVEALRRWQQVVRDHADRLAALITDEMGKTSGESIAEAQAVAAKIDVTLDDVSLGRVREYEVAVTESRAGHCRFKPHGVMAVIGPFNFPAHLPNGHFVPALLLGNTIVFKPSEKTPAVGQLLAELIALFQVAPDEQAVVLRLGRYARTVEPGLRWHARGLERIYKQRVTITQELEFGYRTKSLGPPPEYEDHPEEKRMLTGDANLVDVEFVVQYRIIDLFDYLFQVQDVPKVIRDVSQAAMREAVLASRTMSLGFSKPVWLREIPILALENNSRFSIRIGAERASWMRLASRTGSLVLFTPSSSRMNCCT